MSEIVVAPGTTMLEGLVKNPQVALCELVWNAFDADAKTVSIGIENNDFGALELVRIADDGYGMTRKSAEGAFSLVGDSWKRMPGTKSVNGRPVHGKHGRGRFAAFAVGDAVNWDSTARDVEGDELASIRVEGRREHLRRFDIDDTATIVDDIGTVVTIVAVTEAAIAAFDERTGLHQRLLTEFALHLDRHEDFEIEFLGKPVDPGAVITAKKEIEVATSDGVEGPVSLTIIEWDLSDVERRLYLCKEDGTVTGELPPGIQAVGAEFTAYLSWDGFVHDAELLLEGDTESPAGKVVEAGRAALRTYLAGASRRREAKTIERWRKEGVYPYFGEPKSDVEKATRQTFNVVAMAASRTVDEAKSTSSKALALSLLKETFENGPESLLPILKQFTKLSNARIAELSNLLERTTLAHLISMGREVADRIDFIHGLNALLFDKVTKKKMLERRQLHRILANETWVFGEEWSLTGDDERLQVVLRKYLEKLGLDVELADKAPIVREDGRVAIPDLVLGRQLETRENHFAHLVVELKRPSHTLNDGDVSQLRSYASAITNDERFDQPNSSWEFWLIGNDVDNEVDEQRNQDYLPFGVVQSSKKYKLVVRTWAEVLGDAEHRLKFVQRSLQFESNQDTGLASMREKYEEYLPDAALVGEEQQTA
ncbi:ATP-binding protein [Rhodococcus globerulus]|uniref:ATP-binding protein n=1 Tax=Rhodococcus globerulus TaxID=33008 RepID=UPI003019DF50